MQTCVADDLAQVREGILSAPVPSADAARSRFPGRFALALAAAFAEDGGELARAFHGLSDEGADALGRELLAGLELAAELTSDRRAWAFACNRIPWSHWRSAAAELAQRIDAWVVPTQRRRRGTPRSRLASLALRLLRAGTGGRELLRQLDVANATLDPPLRPDDVGAVAVWAAGAVRGHRHVAG